MEKDLKKMPILIVSVFFLCLLCSIFSVLCLYSSSIAFITRNVILFSVLTSAIFATVALLCIGWILTEKTILTKSVFTALFFILFCLVLCFILQKTGFFAVIQNEDSLQQYLEKAGIWMPIFYIALQYLQVIILPIPGIVSTAAGVALFGAFFTTIYSLIGIILGSITAFFIGRKLGVKAVEWLLGDETLKKWQKKLHGKDNFLLTFAFILPFFPDDILCFIAGLSTMSSKFFISLICISRFFAVAATCYSFGLIPFNTWWGLATWGGIIVVLAVVFFLLYKNFNKIQVWYGKRFKKKDR